MKKHRPAAIVGGIAGLILVAGWFGFDYAMTPAVPVLKTAPATEFVSFIFNPRGLDRMADIEQREFLGRWKEQFNENPERKNELKTALLALSDEDRKAFTGHIFKHLKQSFMDDAARYASLTAPADKSEFCRSRVDEFAGQSTFLREIAVIFKSDFTGPDQFQEWVLKNTTPDERQIGEPYVEALRRVSMQMRKESRSTTTAKG